jgi:CBS domain-containing protein
VNSAYSELVGDVMVSDVHTITVGQTLHEVLDLMLENGVATVPVVNQDRACVGMIAAVDLLAPTHALDHNLQELATESQEGHEDFVEIFERSGLSESAVEDFMSTNVVSVATSVGLPDAAVTMLENQIHHLAVLDESSRLVGILSTMDILNAFARHRPRRAISD